MLNTLLVGLGARGRTMLEPGIYDAPDWRIVAAADPAEESRNAAAELAPDLPLFPDYESALAESECDVVLICSPAPLHGRHIAIALEAGKHVVVEKPFTETHREAVKLTQLAEQKRLKIAVGQNMRYLPLFRELRARVDGGDWGKVGYLTLTHNRYRPSPRNLTDMPHAWLMDNGIHDWDRVLAVVQRRPIRIHVKEFDTPWSAYKQGAAHALIEFEGGLQVITQGSFIAQSNEFRLRMETEKGTVIADSEQAYRIVTAESDERVEPGGDHTAATKALADAITAYMNGGDEPEVSARNNLRSLQLVCAGVRSAEEGRPIDIPEAADGPVD